MPKQTDVARRIGVDFLSTDHSREDFRIVIGELVKNNPTALAEALLHTAYRGDPHSQHGRAARWAYKLKGFKYMVKVVKRRYPGFTELTASERKDLLKKWRIPQEGGHDHR